MKKPYLVSIVCLCLAAVWVTGCSGRLAANSPTELKYLLIEKFGGMGESGGIFYCDSDAYPVAVQGQEQKHALEQFSEIEKNTEEFQTILRHINLGGVANLSTEQKILIYREHKKLRALVLEPSEETYKFQFAISEDQAGFMAGFAIEGIITPQGEITILQKEPIINQCPICLAGATRIDTPNGQMAVKELRPGMTVWTNDASGARLPAVIIKMVRVPVPASHQVVHLLLDDGRELFASPGHPMADGRLLGNLVPGDRVDGAHVVSAERIPYEETATYDILPSGETGFYWGDGILMGSTLAPSSPAMK